MHMQIQVAIITMRYGDAKKLHHSSLYHRPLYRERIFFLPLSYHLVLWSTSPETCIFCSALSYCQQAEHSRRRGVGGYQVLFLGFATKASTPCLLTAQWSECLAIPHMVGQRLCAAAHIESAGRNNKKTRLLQRLLSFLWETDQWLY